MKVQNFYTGHDKGMPAYLWKEAPSDSPVSVDVQPSTTFYWNRLPISAFPNRCDALKFNLYISIHILKGKSPENIFRCFLLGISTQR
jgi:hypothetical protein